MHYTSALYINTSRRTTATNGHSGNDRRGIDVWTCAPFHCMHCGIRATRWANLGLPETRDRALPTEHNTLALKLGARKYKYEHRRNQIKYGSVNMLTGHFQSPNEWAVALWLARVRFSCVQGPGAIGHNNGWQKECPSDSHSRSVQCLPRLPL